MDPLNPALRGVLVATLMLLVGVPPTFRLVVFPALERRGIDTTRANDTVLTVVGTALIGAAFTATAIAIGDVRPTDPGSFAAWASTTQPGMAWTGLVAVASMLGALTVTRYLRPRSVPRDHWLAAATVGALAMLVAFCATRYSVAIESSAVALIVKVGHMTGAGLWVGGLVVLAALPTLLPRSLDADDEPARVALAVVRRFSVVAVAGVTVAFATGVVIAAWHVPTPTALATTPYGLLLSAKVGLVLIAAAIGGFNRLIVHERIDRSVRETTDRTVLPGLLTIADPIVATDAVPTITRSVRVELAILLVATALSVVLTTAMTPSYELLGPTVAASGGVFGGVLLGFANLLKLGAVGIALTGSLALGYEVGKLGTAR
ncbi:copper resistance D family protein [Halalkalicoccus tibetensis]|uniref:Copper resistance D family protein n=1 Tax=Halalkalicoccus tibetensis TaxID=175632 RepID=A0ABD5V4R4_9EURY